MLLAVAVPAEAQQTRTVTRIGYLSSVNPASESARAEGIRLALHERGYIEGQNIAIEYRYGEGKIDHYPELANELVRLKSDIIVVAGGIPSPSIHTTTRRLTDPKSFRTTGSNTGAELQLSQKQPAEQPARSASVTRLSRGRRESVILVDSHDEPFNVVLLSDGLDFVDDSANQMAS
jgi:ABC-type uncharacterized transport system substrate-binding protein